MSTSKGYVVSFSSVNPKDIGAEFGFENSTSDEDDEDEKEEAKDGGIKEFEVQHCGVDGKIRKFPIKHGIEDKEVKEDFSRLVRTRSRLFKHNLVEI